MQGTLVLYYADLCPNSWTVRLASRELGLTMEEKLIDESNTAEFEQVSPKRRIPTLMDGTLSLWDSRPLVMYLADKYGDGGTLYPKDPLKRFAVNKMMLYDEVNLANRFAQCYLPVIQQGASVDIQKQTLLRESLSYLDHILAESRWIAGHDLTIADHCCVSIVAACKACKFCTCDTPNLKRWMADCQRTMVGHKEVLGRGIKVLEKLLENIPALQ